MKDGRCMNNLVKEITHNTGRVFIIGDLHGCYDDLIRKLDEVGFNYDEDLCLSVGDLVDRGPKSLDCFNLVYRSWFKAVRGNHEQFCADYFEACANGVGDQLRDSHASNGGLWFYQLPDDVMRVIADEINNMPVALILNRGDKKYLVVHGDLPFIWYSLDDLKSGLSSSNQETYMNTILWGRKLIKNIFNSDYHIKQFDGVEKVYFGHTVIPEVKERLNYVFIDTGCVFKDQYPWAKLTMIEIN